MKVRIVIPLENINLDVGTEIAGFTVLAGNSFLQFRGSEVLVLQYGKELAEDIERQFILFYEGSPEDNPLIKNLSDLTSISDNVSNYFHSFFSLLWLIKDNSVYTPSVFVHELTDGKLYSSRIYNITTNRRCECSGIDFYKDEMLTAIQNVEIAERYLNKDIGEDFTTPIFDNGIQPSPAGYMHYNFNRLVRAYDFLHFARTQIEPVTKITFYVTAYECLFTSSSSEMTHQVSERASLYVGGTRRVKQSNYNLLKEAYSIRSRYIHGDTINRGREYFLGILDPLDELTRKVFNKVLNEPDIFLLTSSEGDKKKFEQYFKDLIFQ